MNRMRGELWEMGSTITDSWLASHQKKIPAGGEPAGSMGSARSGCRMQFQQRVMEGMNEHLYRVTLPQMAQVNHVLR
jgi:hypothetical protein